LTEHIFTTELDAEGACSAPPDSLARFKGSAFKEGEGKGGKRTGRGKRTPKGWFTRSHPHVRNPAHNTLYQTPVAIFNMFRFVMDFVFVKLPGSQFKRKCFLFSYFIKTANNSLTLRFRVVIYLIRRSSTTFRNVIFHMFLHYRFSCIKQTTIFMMSANVLAFVTNTHHEPRFPVNFEIYCRSTNQF